MGPRFYKLAFFAVAAYSLIHRLGSRWGATDEEVDSPLPGDQFIPHPMIETTHAVTINATPAQVWPWIVQGGYGRAGWYTDADWYKYFEAFMLPATVPGDERPQSLRPRSADTILPEFQHLAVGDIVPDGPPGSAFFTVVQVEPNRTLALLSTSHLQYISPTFLRGTSMAAGGDFTWTFVLTPIAEHSTRLLIRTRCNLYPRGYKPFILAPTYLLDFLLCRQMLTGIKQRVEKRAANAVTPATESMAA